MAFEIIQSVSFERFFPDPLVYAPVDQREFRYYGSIIFKARSINIFPMITSWRMALDGTKHFSVRFPYPVNDPVNSWSRRGQNEAS